LESADEPEVEVEKRKSFFSMANVKSQIAGLIPTTKDDIWKQVISLKFFPMFTFF
jgi:hypothetical protein